MMNTIKNAYKGAASARVVQLAVQPGGTESCTTLAFQGRKVRLRKRVQEMGAAGASFLHWLESGTLNIHGPLPLAFTCEEANQQDSTGFTDRKSN